MIISENTERELKEKCVSILLKYPELFPISDTIIPAASFRYKDNREKIVRYQLSSYIGIDFILRIKISSVSEILWEINPEDRNKIDSWIIKSVLSEYTNRLPTGDEIKLWKNMIKIEELD